MKNNNETPSNHGQTDPPLVDDLSAHDVEPQGNKAKTGIGGCLLYPLLFLIAQPILFVYILMTSRNSLMPMTTHRIFWPYLIYDLVLVGAVIILLVLFIRKKAILPAMFILFLVSFAIFSGLLTNLFWRLPAARVTGRNPLLSHMVVLAQCFLLVPYFALDDRVKRTFICELEDRDIVDQMVKPIAPLAGKLYSWLEGRGKKVGLYVLAFVILVFLFDVVVDSIVLYGFLS